MDRDLRNASKKQAESKADQATPGERDVIAEARRTLVEWLRAKNQNKVEAKRRK